MCIMSETFLFSGLVYHFFYSRFCIQIRNSHDFWQFFFVRTDDINKLIFIKRKYLTKCAVNNNKNEKKND